MNAAERNVAIAGLTRSHREIPCIRRRQMLLLRPLAKVRPELARTRWIGACVLVAFAVAGQLSLIVHQSWVRHAICAQHGESVHLDGQKGAAPSSAAGVGSAPVPTATDSHHCVLASHRRERLVSPASAQALRAPEALLSGRLAPAAVLPAAPVAVLRLAPKNSPPV